MGTLDYETLTVVQTTKIQPMQAAPKWLSFCCQLLADSLLADTVWGVIGEMTELFERKHGDLYSVFGLAAPA